MSHGHPSHRTTTTEQSHQIEKLRQTLEDVLTPDLDTDLNLYRWVHGWNGNIREASQRFRTYIENRKAFHLDHIDFPDRFLTHPIFQNYGLYFSFSTMPEQINPYDDSIVVIQRLENIDFHRVAKVLTCGQFIELYFVICERAFRQILKRELETGKPCSLTIIYDMANFPILNYINPNAPIHKIHKLCLHLLQDYYCDILHRVYIVNAPTMLNIVLEIVKKFLNPVTQEKLVIIPDKETLLKNIHPNVVPVYFDGNLKLEKAQLEKYAQVGINLNPDTCVLNPRPVTDGDHFIPKRFPVATKTEYLKPKQKFEVELKTGNIKQAKLHWQFRVNSDVQFGIWRVGENGQRTLAYPRLLTNSPKLPEEGHITCDEAWTKFILEFANHSTAWFSLKLEYAAYIEDMI